MTHEEELRHRCIALEAASRIERVPGEYSTLQLAQQFFEWLNRPTEAGKATEKLTWAQNQVRTGVRSPSYPDNL